MLLENIFRHFSFLFINLIQKNVRCLSVKPFKFCSTLRDFFGNMSDQFGLGPHLMRDNSNPTNMFRDVSLILIVTHIWLFFFSTKTYLYFILYLMEYELKTTRFIIIYTSRYNRTADHRDDLFLITSKAQNITIYPFMLYVN